MKAKSEAKSVQNLEVKLWSKKYYSKETPARHENNIYDGFLFNPKTREKIFFHSAGGFLKAVEQAYRNGESKE